MRIIKILFFHGLVLTIPLASMNASAADQSICHSAANVVLYNNGSLKSCQLKDDYDANAIRCKNDGQVTFYANGSLESCVLSASSDIAGNRCKQDGQISFYIDGKLKSCVKRE